MEKADVNKHSKKRRANMDDGFNSELVVGAVFDGSLEMPTIKAPSVIIAPSESVPFSMRKRVDPKDAFLTFFEWDPVFAELLIDLNPFYDELRDYQMVATLDCSLYRDAPLAVQVANIYRSRAFGYSCQKHGVNICPLVRWSDERTYTDLVFPEPPSFLGIEHGSPVIVSTYGCISTNEDMRHFRSGLIKMLEYIEPSLVFVYGSMPDKVFKGLLELAEFVNYPDWTTRMRGGKRNG